MLGIDLKISLFISFLIHSLAIGGLCLFGCPSTANFPGAVFLVEISTEDPAPLGPGGGALQAAEQMPVPLEKPAVLAARIQQAAKPEVLALKPPKKIAAPQARVEKAAADESARASAAPDFMPASWNGSGDSSGYGSPDGTPGGMGTGSAAHIRLLEAPKPPYPWAARRDGFEGKAVFNVLVSADGSVQAVNLAAGSGRNDCDQVALNTIREKWRFAAAMINGSPISTWGRVSVRYQLQ